jgi:hypothetical protein
MLLTAIAGTLILLAAGIVLIALRKTSSGGRALPAAETAAEDLED